jgi:hypothetical protein
VPSNFERTKIVLDILDARARAATGGSVDGQVITCLNSLSAAYPMLMAAGRQPVNYSHPSTHLAYAFRSLTCHADLLYRSLAGASPAVAAAMSGNPVKVVCVGGGPGSDILGTIKFVERHGLTNKSFHFTILDREPAWSNVRSALGATFGNLAVSHGFELTDLAGGAPWVANWNFADADIYTISFCLSEVWIFDGNGSVTGFMDKLISSAKAGALFVYSDNGGPSFLPKVEKCFNRPDVQSVFAADDTWMLIGGDEQQSHVQTYVARYGQETKKTGNVNRRIWKKV